MDRGVIKLLGLEPAVYESIGSGEKSLYRLVFICFVALFVISMISSYYLAFLLTSNYFYSLVLGAFIVFVVTFVFRFSLIIIRKPISAPESETVELSTKTITSFPARILEKLKGIRFTADGPIPGFSSLLRIVFLGMFALVVLFPLASFLHPVEVKNLMEVKRKEVIKDFKKQQQFQRDKLSREELAIRADLMRKINLGQRTLSKNSFSVRKAKSDLKKTSIFYQKEKKALKIEQHTEMKNFRTKISKKFFPMLIFQYAHTFRSFNSIAFLILILFILPQIMMVLLKTGKNFNYAKTSAQLYQQSILIEYQSVIDAANRDLNQRFKKLDKRIVIQSSYADAPFNSKKSTFTRKNMTYQSFLDSFNTPKTV